MKIGNVFAAAAFALVISVLGVAANADVISQELSGKDPSNGPFYWSESFTTAPGGPWNEISVNFYTPDERPLAGGTGYLFTAPYAGPPSGLPGAGALATTVATSGSYWTFAQGFTLASSTEYYFYEDGLLAILGDASSSINTSSYTPFSYGDFITLDPRDLNYAVSGSATAPEPESWALMLIGFTMIGGGLRSRRYLKARPPRLYPAVRHPRRPRLAARLITISPTKPPWTPFRFWTNTQIDQRSSRLVPTSRTRCRPTDEPREGLGGDSYLHQL